MFGYLKKYLSKSRQSNQHKYHSIIIEEILIQIKQSTDSRILINIGNTILPEDIDYICCVFEEKYWLNARLYGPGILQISKYDYFDKNVYEKFYNIKVIKNTSNALIIFDTFLGENSEV